MGKMYDYDWWYDFREKTFDKWAEDAGVTYKEIEGKDYTDHGGYKTYPCDAVFDRGDRRKNHLALSKIENPIDYFFLYSIPEVIESCIVYPSRWLDDAYYWVRWRTVDKYHVLDLKLEPRYYDKDTQLEQALWVILLDYVEHEAAWMNIHSDGPSPERDKRVKEFRKNGSISRKDGLEFLEFHLTVEDEYMTKKYMNQKRKEWQKIKDAYLYYRDIRPVMVKAHEDLEDSWHKDHRTKRGSKEHDQLFKDMHKAEVDIIKEDTKHLKNIVEQRGHLWT